MGVWGWCRDDRDDIGKMGKTWGWWGRQGRHHYHDKHVGGHLQFFTCVCACMHAFVCMCTCVGTPPHPSIPPPPTCPLPRATGSPKHQNSIKPDLIEIMQFCLKIIYLWTFWTHIDYSWSPWTAPTHLPHPQSWGNQNQKNYNNSWMDRDISILFEDLGPLNSPAHI